MDVREVQPTKQLSKLVTEEGMLMDVREVQFLKQPFPKYVKVKVKVKVKVSSLYVMLSGMQTYLAEPLYLDSVAVFSSVFSLYLNPSSVL